MADLEAARQRGSHLALRRTDGKLLVLSEGVTFREGAGKRILIDSPLRGSPILREHEAMTAERGRSFQRGEASRKAKRNLEETALRPVRLFGAALPDDVRYGVWGSELAGVPAGRDVLHKSAGVAWLLEAEGASASFVDGDLAEVYNLGEERRGSDRAGEGSGSIRVLSGTACRWRHPWTGRSCAFTRVRSECPRRSSAHSISPGIGWVGGRDGVSEGPVSSSRPWKRTPRSGNVDGPTRSGPSRRGCEGSVGEFQACPGANPVAVRDEGYASLKTE